MFDIAKKYLVGGVNSPVRSCKAVDSIPKFIVKGEGPFVWDSEGNKYIDYVGSFGAAIAGHANPKVMDFIKKTMSNGLGFSAPHPLEIEHAKAVLARLPGSEKIRFVNSGTEAVQTAIRLARGITKKNKIIKFSGCYHGHIDSTLVNAGSGALTTGQPSSPGIIGSEHTLVAEYNDCDAVKQIANEFKDDLAAIVVEPIAGNMGLVMPTPNFLSDLRSICDACSAILIFDEVMTGFRVHEHCAQGLFGIQPDLTTLGKIIGGGLPVGAIAGPEKYMKHLSPEGPVYQAGTLSGNPLTMAAGFATLDLLEPGYTKNLHKHTKMLTEEIANCANKHGVPIVTNAVGGMWGIFLSETKVNNLEDVKKCNLEQFKKLFKKLLANGIYWPPSAFEAVFVSIAHNKETLEQTIAIFDKVFSEIA